MVVWLELVCNRSSVVAHNLILPWQISIAIVSVLMRSEWHQTRVRLTRDSLLTSWHPLVGQLRQPMALLQIAEERTPFMFMVCCLCQKEAIRKKVLIFSFSRLWAVRLVVQREILVVLRDGLSLTDTTKSDWAVLRPYRPEYTCLCTWAYRGFLTRMVYLYYISCLRYTILVGNLLYILVIWLLYAI